MAVVLIKGEEEVRYPTCDWRLTSGGGDKGLLAERVASAFGLGFSGWLGNSTKVC